MSMLLNICAILCLSVYAHFMLSYHWLSKGAWRESEAGWNVMSLAAAPVAFSALRMASLVFAGASAPVPSYPGSEVLRLVVYIGLIAVGLWRTRMMMDAQMEGRECRHDLADVAGAAALRQVG